MAYMFNADEIKALRAKSGLTLAAFGREMGVSESTACNWEIGRQHPRYDTLVKMNDFAERLRGGKKKLAGAGS